GQPVHRLEKASARRSDSALVTMHSLACELLPEWSEFFDVLLENGGMRQW
ncbi:ParA family protein, partial [Escherichia coli]